VFAHEIATQSEQIKEEAKDDVKKGVVTKIGEVWQTANAELQRAGTTAMMLAGAAAAGAQALKLITGAP
jgi:hypothetical protein